MLAGIMGGLMVALGLIGMLAGAAGREAGVGIAGAALFLGGILSISAGSIEDHVKGLRKDLARYEAARAKAAKAAARARADDDAPAAPPDEPRERIALGRGARRS